MIEYVDTHLELTARNLYKQAFFGGTVTDATKARRKAVDAPHSRFHAARELQSLSAW